MHRREAAGHRKKEAIVLRMTRTVLKSLPAVSVSLALSLSLSTAPSARADVNELLARVPAYANAVVVVDAAFVAGAGPNGAGDAQAAAGRSPAGAPAAGAPESGPRSPFPLPRVAGLKSLVLAARIHTGSMEPAWEVALMEVGQKPSMLAVARASGGYPDTAAGRPAAVCGNDVYCVALSDRVLAAIYPADRQFATRWLGEQRPGGAGAAGGATAGAAAPESYLRTAAAQVSAQTPVVIALDLTDALSEVAVRRVLEDRPKWAAALGADEKAAAALLAGVRGVTVRVGGLGAEGAAGSMTVDFAGDVTPLAPAARDLVTGVMAEWGVSVPDLAQWEFGASGQSITGQGNLSVQGIERLVEFLSIPGVSAPAEGAGARTAGAGGAADDPKRARAEASRKYFKTVSGVLDSFRPGTSLADGAAWLTRSAKRIDQLPADNVDGELLLWGADVSSNLRAAAASLSAGQQRVRARTSAIQMTAAYAGYGYEADAQQAAQARTDRENARRQANQAGAEERAAIMQEASKSLEAALDSRGKVRVAMSERYGGGF